MSKITDKQRSEMLTYAVTAGAKMQFGRLSMLPDDLERYTDMLVDRINKLQAGDHKSCITWSGWDADGNCVARGVRSSAEPDNDLTAMTSFLELEQAHRIRGVDIKPFRIGSLWVMSEEPQKKPAIWMPGA